jgi:hypothetical protein
MVELRGNAHRPLQLTETKRECVATRQELESGSVLSSNHLQLGVQTVIPDFVSCLIPAISQ